MRLLCAAAFMLLAQGAQAEVKSSTAGGFHVESKRIVPVAAAEAYAALGRVPA